MIFFPLSFRESGREEGRGRERERKKKKRWKTETSTGCLLHAPYRGWSRNPGMYPDQESNQDLSVHGRTLNPLSHTGWAKK